MRRFVMEQGGRAGLAIAIAATIAIGLAACEATGNASGRDCAQNGGGVPGVAVPPGANELPTAFGNAGNQHAMGSDNVMLTIRPVPNVHTIRHECFANSIGYFAAIIQYAPGETRQLPEWPAWTPGSGPAYLFVEGPAAAPKFAYDIYIKDPAGSGNLVSLRHGQGFWQQDPSAQADGASIGLPAQHLSDAEYLRKLAEVGGPAMAAVAARVRARQQGAPRAGPPVDDPNAWFNCAQGCCTATGIM